MRVSVLGTGRMGKGLVSVLSKQMPLLWGSRTPEKAKKIIRENGIENTKAVSYDEALASDVIFHTMWFRDLIPWAEANREQLTGKIVIDPANPFTADFSDFELPWGMSAAEELQRVLPESNIVGAFKNTYFKVLEQPVHNGLMSDVYVTSDYEDAKRIVINLFDRLPFRVIDGGALANNRTIERMTLFEREVALREGHYPYVSFRLFGSEQ
ncbi:NADPH-dependent F420 reductase [Paenibacillus thermotolerans]|uniref:NADPH-dependent F420 reductase n=1 Tax=Paenibacillus thermotolerans TaxID=3027807 RepID=UPI002367E66E|nr:MULTISPECIES: NAD(P)-binding domain-containing protein [unclassified Paenibacillus]